jgi:hypothetical protein
MDLLIELRLDALPGDLFRADHPRRYAGSDGPERPSMMSLGGRGSRSTPSGVGGLIVSTPDPVLGGHGSGVLGEHESMLRP